jgi:hypothetical protein
MEKDTGYGLLSQYGLDLGDEQNVRTALRNKRIQQAMEMNPNSRGDPRGEAFSRLGASIGNALGQKFGGPNYSMPPEIQARLNTVKDLKTSYGEWEKANPEVRASERAEKYQEMLAEAAFKNGLPDIAVDAITKAGRPAHGKG